MGPEIEKKLGVTTDSVAWLKRREDFYGKAFGPIQQPGIFHWFDDGDPHIDVYVLTPHKRKGETLLITGGMSDRTQPGVSQVDAGAPPRVEILTHVSAKMSGDGLKCVVFALRELASLPFSFGVKIADGTLVKGSRPIMPGSSLWHAAITAEVLPPGSFSVDGTRVRFMTVEFLTPQELNWAVDAGGSAVFRHLRDHRVSAVLDPQRLSTIA